MRILLATLALLALPASAAAQIVPPNCGGVFDVTVAAGFGTSGPMCDGNRIEVVTPPAHGTVSSVVLSGIVQPLYEADADAAGMTDRYEFRAFVGDRATPVYAVTVTITAAPTSTVLPPPPYVGPAPLIDARVLGRHRAALATHGLPLRVGCDVACDLSVSVRRGKRLAGTATRLAPGRVTVPLTGPVRRGSRLLVAVSAVAPDRPPSTFHFVVRVR